ncbi:MAG: hemopexin repeat-containing protein [Candidatus Tectomicrobia bacterium]|nr:hemopexin repeat-containing protein [Candidatus Tectomicrobia bacterium]
MALQPPEYRYIPGMEIVGRGIYLRPRQPYELKDVLFDWENVYTYTSGETQQTYRVPHGYAVNDSPPMPAAKSLNQVMIEESWERMEKQTSVDANVAMGSIPFSVDINASQISQLRSEEDAYYALRNTFIPLWAVYLPNVSQFSEEKLDLEVPTPFRHQYRKAYERFFERFGTHYVKRAWVGGKAMLAFTIVKSSDMTKDDIKAGITASYAGVGSGSVDTSLQESKEKLQNNSSCTVFGKGGNELKLAALSSLDEARYNEWVATISTNPQVIEFEAVGIWTLIRDEKKAQALLDAYKEATTFTPISAILRIDQYVYFIRNKGFSTYDIEQGLSTKPSPLIDKWPTLAKVGFDKVDSGLNGAAWASNVAEDMSRKVFLFRRNQYVRLDLETDRVDDGYPRPIAEGWPGVTFERIDAVLSDGINAVYFFQGNEYIRFNMVENRADAGYPEAIGKRWVGVTFDRIDAAIYWGNGKVYFFRGDQHIRYDTVMYRADPGYPKFIIGSYVEDWKFFE